MNIMAAQTDFMTGRSKARTFSGDSSFGEPPFRFPSPSRIWLSSSTTLLPHSLFKHESPMYHPLTKRIRLFFSNKERGKIALSRIRVTVDSPPSGNPAPHGTFNGHI